MSASRQKKRLWEDRFERLLKAKQKADEDFLVAIYQARQDELSTSDVAYMIGDRSSSGIGAKEAKGKAILDRRKGGSGQS